MLPVLAFELVAVVARHHDTVDFCDFSIDRYFLLNLPGYYT
jgi:hypothetical protein